MSDRLRIGRRQDWFDYFPLSWVNPGLASGGTFLFFAERVSVRSLIIILASIAATSSTAAEVTATRLDGTAVVGDLTSWDGQTLSVSTEADSVQLSAADLLSLRWSPAAPPTIPAEKLLQPVVELVDGTILPIENFSRQAEVAQLSLRGNMPQDIKNVQVPNRTVAAVRLQPLQNAVTRQWEEIRAQQFASDVLVLQKRGGQSLDYIEGTIGDITAERIEFKLEDEMQRVERSKVAGMIFFRAGHALGAPPLCILHGREDLRASVATASLSDRLLRVTTVAGAKLVWPLDDVQSADFSAGKVVFLSDVEPASEERTPLIGLPAGASLAAEYDRPRRDQSAFGGPLMLWFPGSDSSAPVGHTQTFGRGLAVRSRTVLVYRVPRGFTRLLGVAGIEPSTRGDGSAKLTITGDERSLLDVELTGDQSPQDLELDITGVKRLKIVVDYGQNLDTGDWVNLCEVRMVK